MKFSSRFSGLALLGAAAISPLAIGAPAHAAPCSIIGSTGTFSYADVTTGFSCTVGDKTLSNISLGGLPSDATFTFIDMGTQHTLAVAGTFTGASLNSNWSYKLTATNFPTLGVAGVQTQATVGFGGTLPESVISVTAPASAVGSVTSQPGGAQSPALFISPVVSYIDVTTSWQNATGSGGNTIASITDKYVQAPSTATTPGPLPIIGAGMAFGFSRGIRRRVKVAS